MLLEHTQSDIGGLDWRATRRYASRGALWHYHSGSLQPLDMMERRYHTASLVSVAQRRSSPPSGVVAPTPVPTLPLFGLGILVSLLGLFGLRKLRQ